MSFPWPSSVKTGIRIRLATPCEETGFRGQIRVHLRSWPQYVCGLGITPQCRSCSNTLSKEVCFFPLEESSLLKDPMEKKMDCLLRHSYSSSAAVCKASLVSVPMARSFRIWLSQLSRDHLLDSLAKMKSAANQYTENFSEGLGLNKLSQMCAVDKAVVRRCLFQTPLLRFALSDLQYGSQLKPILESLKGLFLPCISQT